MKYPQPGAYRELFKRGLQLLLLQTISLEDRQAAEHYIKLLDDSAYKFGKYEVTAGQQHYASGELFFRS